jgi:NADP-dependent 3-hydroxy acid dehydrogenase YdfG
MTTLEVTAPALLPYAQHLADKVVLLTGASQGIGFAIAQALAPYSQHHGLKLAISGRNPQRLAQATQQLQHSFAGLDLTPLPADVQDAHNGEWLVSQTVQRYGKLNILINNAGIGGKVGLLNEVSDEQLVAMVATNLTAPLLLAKHALRVMVPQQEGTIININSIAGKRPFPYWVAYDATKAGLKAATDALSEEQRSNGIRVIGIYPGAVATHIWDTLDLDQANQPDAGSILQPHQVAEAVLFALGQPANTLVSDITLEPTRPAL